jgi:hypothetical protein
MPNSAILTGQYTDFSNAWYNKYGGQIIVMFIIEIFVPHVNPWILVGIFKCWRKYDRRWGSSKSVTRQLLQSSYEWLHTGPEFVWDTRLAQIVCLFWVGFQYSIALPLVLV